ncbi:MAG TPA: hypothetical protein VFD33_05085, partial [Bacillota bacterium]|nr:hypothetical protein [Bacillota bacterium]
MTSIQFAKDGWFGVISDEINFENMTIIAQGVADYLNESCDTSASVVIGYDTRFLSREYAWAIQQVLTGNRIRVFFHKKPAPTSFLSLSARLYKADLGIMVTGKGRPARYSGMVFRSSQGRPLGRDFLSSLFNHLYRRYPRAADENRDLLTYIDVSKAYMDLLSGLITIKRPGPKMPLVISDSCFGSVGGYIKDILRHYGFNTIAIRTKPNPGFMDCVPYPSPRNMQPTFRLIQQRHGQIGLFFSGDGSSLGVIDSRGHIVPDQWVSAIVLKEWLDLAGEDYKVYTDIFTPSISVPILSYRGLAVRAPMYELFEQTEQEEETESYIVWDRQSIYCSDFIPDRDAMFQAMVFVSALVRHEYDWDTMLAGLLRITGMRTFLYRSIKLNKNIWSRKKTLLESYGRIGSLGNIIDMQEEDEDLKLWMMDGSWAGLSYNSAEDHLSMYY